MNKSVIPQDATACWSFMDRLLQIALWSTMDKFLGNNSMLEYQNSIVGFDGAQHQRSDKKGGQSNVKSMQICQ